MEQIMRTNIT
jgi:hypothetical protein